MTQPYVAYRVKPAGIHPAWQYTDTRRSLT